MPPRAIAARAVLIVGIVASVATSEYQPTKTAPAQGAATPSAWFAVDELANPGAGVLEEGAVVTHTFTLALTPPATSEAGYSSLFEFTLEARDPTVFTTAWLTATTEDGFVLDSAEWASIVSDSSGIGRLEIEDVLPGCAEGVRCSTRVVVTVEATGGELNAGWYAVFSAEDNALAEGRGEQSEAIELDVVTE